jgi:hypothetical protein
MRLILLIIMIVFFSSCSTKYNGPHKDFKKFSKAISYCLKKSCINKSKNVLHNISFISSALAYGGGGGGGGGGSGGGSLQQDKISYKVFNICMKEKGYFKDENGIFKLPHLTCD